MLRTISASRKWAGKQTQEVKNSIRVTIIIFNNVQMCFQYWKRRSDRVQENTSRGRSNIGNYKYSSRNRLWREKVNRTVMDFFKWFELALFIRFQLLFLGNNCLCDIIKFDDLKLSILKKLLWKFIPRFELFTFFFLKMETIRTF